MPDRIVALRRAWADDIPFIMATERLPGYDRLLGKLSEEAHRAAMQEASCVYLLGTAGGSPAGFAILRDLDNRSGNVWIKRFVVARPGEGFGSRFVPAVIAWVFRETPAYRCWLNVVADNARARHVYRARGFVEEGVKREAFLLADGERRDIVMMSMLRREWREGASVAGR